MIRRNLVFVFISLAIALITFIFSFLSNLLLDALFKTLVVFVASFGLCWLLKFVWITVNNEANKQSSSENRDQEERGEQEMNGQFINLTTPDDDHFVPLRPDAWNENN